MTGLAAHLDALRSTASWARAEAICAEMGMPVELVPSTEAPHALDHKQTSAWVTRPCMYLGATLATTEGMVIRALARYVAMFRGFPIGRDQHSPRRGVAADAITEAFAMSVVLDLGVDEMTDVAAGFVKSLPRALSTGGDVNVREAGPHGWSVAVNLYGPARSRFISDVQATDCSIADAIETALAVAPTVPATAVGAEVLIRRFCLDL